MVKRLQKLSKNHSFFLFGARGTGKTTLLKQVFGGSSPQTLWIDLLAFKEENRFGHNPDLLTELLQEGSYQRVIIDEVQKIPKLLDVVHKEKENNKKTQFILTGSSSRKLKRGGGNMLAGRLFYFTIHPLTHTEWGKSFNTREAMQTGTLPALKNYTRLKDKARYLDSYIQTYLKEEILVEQLIRKIHPFKNFLRVAAACSGDIINYSKLARSMGMDGTTVQNYFEILSDTHLGFYLHSFHRSIRKQQNQAPKFFLFDTGVTQALQGKTQTPLREGSYEYGKIFEHFVILEFLRLNTYREKRFHVFYLRDKDGHEVDLVIQKPNGQEILVEIKSTKESMKEHGKNVRWFLKHWDRPCVGQVWSQDNKNRKVGSVYHYHWQTALKKLI